MNEIANQKSTDNNQVFGFIKKLDKINKFNKLASFINSAKFISFNSYNKRHLRADDYLSLSSALRPRLLGSTINNLSKVSSLKHKLIFPLGLVSSIITLSIISSIVLPSLFSSISNVSAASLTLSVPSSISLNLSPTSGSGGSSNSTYAKSSNGNISIRTDANFGYTLSIKSSDAVNKNTLINGANKLTSITNTEGISEDSYKTSGAVNTWGYIPSMFNNTSNTNIRPGPTDAGESLAHTSAANSNNNTYTIAIASKIDNTLASGTYKNSFIINAIANSVSYSITYDLTNGSWNTSQNKSPQTGNTTEGTVRLYSTIPTRSGYTFQGWCTQRPIVNSYAGGTDNCMGITYQAGVNYPLSNTSNTATLYAIWQRNGGCFIAGTLIDTPDGPRPIESITYGDTVYSYDFEHEKIVEDLVDGYYDVERNDVVRLTFDNSTSIEGTYTHRFFSAARDEWIQLGDFKVGDVVRTIGGKDTIVQSTEKIPDNTKVYNLQTEKYHNFFVVVPSSDSNIDNNNNNADNSNDNGNISDNNNNSSNYNKYIVKAVIPDNWDEDDDYLLKRYPILPISTD